MSGVEYAFFVFQIGLLGLLGYISGTLSLILKELRAGRYEQRMLHASGSPVPQAPSEKKSKDPDWTNDPNVTR